MLSELRELELELHDFDFRSEDITHVDRISEAICEMIRSSPLVESIIIGKVANFMFTDAPKPLFKKIFPSFPAAPSTQLDERLLRVHASGSG